MATPLVIQVAPGNFSRSCSPPPHVDSCAHSAKVEARLTPDDIATLMGAFEKAPPEGLNMGSFCRAVQDVLPPGVATEAQLALLFMKIDTSCDGHVDWDEFCSYMMLEFEESGSRRGVALAFPTRGGPDHLVHRDPVVQLFDGTRRDVSGPNKGLIYSMGRDGVWASWTCSGRLRARSELPVPSTRPWVSSCVFSPVVGKVIASFLNGDVYFYDASSPAFDLQYILKGYPQAAISIDCARDPGPESSRACLLLGDTLGNIGVLEFPVYGATLFNTQTTKGQVVVLNLRDMLARPGTYDTTFISHSIHDGWVLEVRAGATLGTFLSCCSNERVALAVHGADHQTAIFRIHKGVYSFDHDPALRVILTGGADGFLRLWNPHVTTAATAVLGSHGAPVRRVQLLVSPPVNEPPALEHARALTLSEDCVVMLWSLRNNSCLHILLRDPRLGQSPISTILLLPGAVLAGTQGGVVVAPIPCKPAPRPDRPETHRAPLCGALYNVLFHQVVTASRKNEVCVWNALTGECMVRFTRAHQNADLSCLAFDVSGKRLLTGASDGSVKVWNFNVGLSLQKLLGGVPGDITAIVPLAKGATTLTAGWSRRVMLFRASQEEGHSDEYYFTPDPNHPGNGHTDDIVSMVACGPDLVASCSYDGLVVVWRADPLCEQSRFATAAVLPPGADSQVERLHFLGTRAPDMYTRPALLTGGAGGWVRLWYLAQGRLAWALQLAPGRAITSVTTNAQADTVMAAGDSTGTVYLRRWQDPAAAGDDTPPAPWAQWVAHDGAVIALELIALPAGYSGSAPLLLLTAALDHRARLWTVPDGALVGTFGQLAPWDLVDPTTYASGATTDTPTSPRAGPATPTPSSSAGSQREASASRELTGPSIAPIGTAPYRCGRLRTKPLS